MWGVLLGRHAVVSRGRHDPLRFEPLSSCDGCYDVRWQEIYERLEELDPATFETTAAKLLHGLGCAPAHAVRMPWIVLCLCAKRRKPQVLGCLLGSADFVESLGVHRGGLSVSTGGCTA